MSAELGSLVVSLEANMVRFNQNMDDAARRTEQSATRMQAGLDAAKMAIGALASVATIGLLANLVKGAIDAADNLRDMSQMTGVAVEELNGLGFAAGQAGGSLETMVAAAGKMNKSAIDAASGGKETGAAYKVLGINVEDATGKIKKADVLMAEVADQFAKFEDGPEKGAIALAIFGKAGADMIPLLNDGGAALLENTEYAKKYSGMTTELADMSDEFNDIMGKLTLQQTSFGNILAEAVLPAVNAVAEEILGATENSNKFSGATEIIRTVLETFLVVGAEVAHIFHMIGDEIGGTAAQMAALGSLDFQGARLIGERMRADQAQALVDHEAFIKKILDRTPKVAADGTPTPKDRPAAPRLPGTPDKKKEGKSDAEKELEEGAKLVAKLKEQAEAYGLAGAALLEYQLAGKGYSETQKQQALAHQANIDGMKAEDAAAKKSADNLRKFVEDAKRAEEQNKANVDQISIGLMTELQQQENSHQMRLAELQIYHDTKLENVMEANALIEAENLRHEQTKAAMQLQFGQQVVGIAGDSAAQLYGVMQAAGLEQTALGKALFIANKAIAVAEIIMNTEVAAAKALALGPIVGPPLAMAVRVMGYAAAGVVIGTTIASAEGGYDIPSGSNPVTQLHEKEMVLPRAQADVIRGLASNGGAAGKGIELTYSPTINIDGTTDMARNRQMVREAVDQGNADLVDRLQRAGRI